MTRENSQGYNPPIERILVLENPVAKNGWRGLRQLEDLKEFSELPSDRVETDCDPSVTEERLSVLEPTDLLYIIGGDGTTNAALRPAIRSQALMLPTRSGNATDLAKSIHGNHEPWQIYAGLQSGTAPAADVHPIEVTINSPDSSDSRLAVNYTSFGYSALASLLLNQPWRHAGVKRAFDALPPHARNVLRLPREGLLLSRAAAKAALFDVVFEDSDEAVHVADISIVHSPRMAKLGRFSIRHTDGYMFTTVSTQAGLPAMSAKFAQMATGKLPGVYRTELSFAIKDDEDNLYYQVDGESARLHGPAAVRVGLARETLRVISSQIE